MVLPQVHQLIQEEEISTYLQEILLAMKFLLFLKNKPPNIQEVNTKEETKPHYQKSTRLRIYFLFPKFIMNFNSVFR